ncbi:MAG: glucuronate isomerase [Bacteroidia bacterium]
MKTSPLENRTAEILHHEYAASQPIIDYHNHPPPDHGFAGNKGFANITDVRASAATTTSGAPCAPWVSTRTL